MEGLFRNITLIIHVMCMSTYPVDEPSLYGISSQNIVDFLFVSSSCHRTLSPALARCFIPHFEHASGMMRVASIPFAMGSNCLHRISDKCSREAYLVPLL